MSVSDSVKKIHDRVVLDADRLSALYATELLDSSPDKEFDRLTELTSKLLELDLVFITLIDAQRHYFLSMHGVPNPKESDRSAAPMYSFCQQVVVANELHTINDVEDGGLVCQDEACNAFGIVAYMGTPLRTPNNERIGSLCVIDTQARVWTEEDKYKIKEMGELVVKEIALRYHYNEHVRAEQDIEAHIERLEQTNIELEKKNRELKKANAAKSNFLATISHEIRTPMNGVIGFTSLLKDTELDYLQHEYADTIRASGEALLDIINDVLDFSAIESGNVQLNVDTFSLHQCVSEALDVISLKAAQKGLDLGYFIDTSVPEFVVGDAGRIRQILVNLLGNAVKFTMDGGIEVEVFLDLDARNVTGKSAFHIVVRDTGIGIEKDKFEEIFHSFSQVDSSMRRHYGGTGLGLSICKVLCTVMDSEIWVESEIEEGSSFHLILNLEVCGHQKDGAARIPMLIKNRKILIGVLSGINKKLLKQFCDSSNTDGHFLDSNVYLKTENRSFFDALLIDPDQSDVPLAILKEMIEEWNKDVPVILIQNLGLQQNELGETISAIINKPIKKSIFYGVLENSIRNNPKRLAATGGMKNNDDKIYNNLRILVAEDNEINQKLMARYLQVLGFKGEMVSSGRGVLEALEKHNYDIILMDIHMPEMDGIEVARAIRSLQESYSDIYIIGITADMQKETRARSEVAGMNDFLSKPITVQDLKATLKKAMATL